MKKPQFLFFRSIFNHFSPIFRPFFNQFSLNYPQIFTKTHKKRTKNTQQASKKTNKKEKDGSGSGWLTVAVAVATDSRASSPRHPHRAATDHRRCLYRVNRGISGENRGFFIVNRFFFTYKMRVLYI
jgi:hypothetical protein